MNAMKRWILPTLFVWTLVGAVAFAALSGRPEAPVRVQVAKGQIAWQTGFESALRAAREQHKPVLVVFESKNCTYCKKMDVTTWRDARVQAQTRGLIPVKVDGDARTDLLGSYGVQAFPDQFLINANGQPVARFEGYGAPDEFAQFLEQSRAKWKG